jgi:hypothetical protein
MILVLPWSISENTVPSDLTFLDINTVGFFQTNTCDHSLSSLVFENINNNKLKILPDWNSELECHGKINGVDYFSNNIKLYVGTNPNIDFILQSLFWIVVLFLIPKSSHKKSKYINLTSSLMVFLFYLHLVGEKGYYERHLREFDISLSLDNFWLLSMLLVFFLLSNVISDLISSRFYNLVNYLPFMFLISGTYNTFNLNIFIFIFSILGMNSILEKKINIKLSILYFILSFLYLYNSQENSVFFDVDKLKGFISSSNSQESIIFWAIIYYLLISGIVYLINESKEKISLGVIKSSMLITGGLSVFFGLLATVNSLFSFVIYYYLGLNKFPMTTLSSVEGNTWRGIAPSAEAYGEYYAFCLLFTFIAFSYYKLKITNLQILLILMNIYGLFKTNNFAAIALLTFTCLLVLLDLRLKNNKQVIIIISLLVSISIGSLLQISNFNYVYSSKALIYEGLSVTKIEKSLPGDQWGRSAIELANFGEILKIEEPNISSSLLAVTKHYTTSKNLQYMPNTVSLISAISVPINRSEKWGIFLAKYNPGVSEFLFGYGPQQIAGYYQEDLTNINTGLVLPHSSLLSYLLFFGIIGLSSLIYYLFINIYQNRKSKIFMFSIFFIIINLIKSDSLLYISNFVLLVVVMNFYKIKKQSENLNNET